MKATITIALLFLCVTYQRAFAQIPLVYNVENTGAACTPPPLPLITQLPAIPLLPDPFKWADGIRGRSTSFSDWECHRNEFKRQIENYEIGPKPSKPDTILANYVPASGGGFLIVIVKKNGKTVTLYSHVSLPAGNGPFPALIGIALANGAGASTGSIPSNVFTDRNIATIEYVHDQVTQYAAGQQVNHAADPFFVMYPEYTCPGNSGQYVAWIWGVSRLIDGLEIVKNSAINPLNIDLNHLGITGCSYAGKMALYAGAFDERIALTIAQENGGGGAPSWRVNHTRPAGTVECIDNTDYSWFAQDRLRKFRNDSVSFLPDDHHELMAMILPRALLETGNTDFTWLGNPANYVDGMATKEIYRTFGIGDRFGFYIDGGHGHCSMPDQQIPAVSAFVDKFMKGNMSVNTDTIMIRPHTAEFDTVNYSRWYAGWGGTILPVQLKTFVAERNGNDITLKWTTTTEQNNKGFIIQSSLDGRNWKDVGFAPTKATGGNSYAEIVYKYGETNNLKEATYYRIVQVDNDNKQTFSESRLIKGLALAGKVLIYPNPSTTGEVKIVFNDASLKDVQVFDAGGKLVRKFNTAQNSLNVTGLKVGSYVLRVNDQNDGSKASYKIVVTR